MFDQTGETITPRKRNFARAGSLTALLIALLPGSALFAQQAGSAGRSAFTQAGDNGQQSTLQEVVVTGTLLKNAAPVGSSVITLDQSTLNATGAITIFDQLQSVPQIDNLGVTEASRNGTGGAGNITYANSINIRGLSPFATLTLLDGHRVPPAGTTGASVDPDSFPSIMLQRVDVVADGASAIYGSDAVAGVANLILRRNVEGVEARVRDGWADGYDQRSLGLLSGHDWGSGQISVGYENNYHSALNGEDRSFFASDQTSRGGLNYDVLQCNPGNIVAGGITYAIPAGGVTAATAGQLLPGTMNLCDVTKYEDIIPKVEHSDVALTFDQQITQGISLYADATYARRLFTSYGAQATGQLEVPTTNAYFVSPPAAALTPCSPAPAAPDCEQVDYWFGKDMGPQSNSGGFSVNYQGTLGVNFALGRGWSFNVDGTAGRDHDQSLSTTGTNNAALTTALGSSTPSTALNVFRGANSSSLLQGIFDSEFLAPGYTGEQVIEAKLNGPAFHMPGGDVSTAIGGQWRHDDVQTGLVSGAPGQQLVLNQYLNRHSKAIYAEVLLPFFGEANALPGAQRLDLDVAVRHEDYSDFGTTTNPKIGLDWSPIHGVTLHGTYGTSFRAPLLTELVGPLQGTFVQTYSDPLSPTGTSVGYTLAGGNLNLKPEKATTYTFGVTFNPRPGANLTADFFDIDYKDQIASYLSDLTILQQADQYGSLINRCPSAACTALTNQYVLGVGPNATPEPVFGPILANPSVFVNGTEQNLGRTRAAGFDLQTSYILPTDHAGTWNVGLTGTWFTKYDVRFTPAGQTFDERNIIGFPPALRLRGNLGWTAGPWDAQLFVNFVNAYTNTETTPTQHVSAYTTLDLNIVYDFGVAFPGRWTKDLQLTVNVLNLADSDPPYVDIPIGPNGGGGFDPNVANPIGRLISVQVQKKF
ncbi:MAG: TonB-dependent receptor plug domain-containing protein [Steroidobacteraceae bacterium]